MRAEDSVADDDTGGGGVAVEFDGTVELVGGCVVVVAVVVVFPPPLMAANTRPTNDDNDDKEGTLVAASELLLGALELDEPGKADAKLELFPTPEWGLLDAESVVVVVLWLPLTAEAAAEEKTLELEEEVVLMADMR